MNNFEEPGVSDLLNPIRISYGDATMSGRSIIFPVAFTPSFLHTSPNLHGLFHRCLRCAMEFMKLPLEIIRYIASCLTFDCDISSLAQTNRLLHHLLDHDLYKHNIRHSGSTALEWACVRGKEPLARRMLELGAPPHATVNEPWKPLALAAMHGHESIVRLFLEKGVDPESTSEWWNPGFFDEDEEDDEDDSRFKCPLILAAEHGHVSVVRALLDHGVDPAPPPSHDKDSPLDVAVMGGHIAVAKLLVDCAVKRRGEKPFTQFAVRLAEVYDQVDMLGYLLEIGADLGTLSGQLDLVTFAVNKGRVDLVQILLERGVGVAHQTRIDSEWAPAGSAPREGSAMVELAMGQLDVDRIAKNQGDAANFLLHVGVQHGLEWLVERLLRSGCDPNMTLLPMTWLPPTYTCDLPEDLTSWTGNSQIVRLLLEAGARKDGVLKRVLIDAIRGGHARVVELLLDHGVDPDSVETWGSLIIESAIEHEETFHLLLDRRVAIADLPSLMGYTIMRGKPRQVQRLLDGGYPLEGFPDESVLELGACNGPAMLQFLFTRGVRADPSSVGDEALFELAIQARHTAVVQMFLDWGFDANFLTSHCRPLQLVFLRNQGDDEAMFDLLIRYGADVNATTPDSHNEPILSFYIKVNDTRAVDEAIRLLLKKGASPLLGDPIRRAPLATAARLGQYRIVELLLDAIPSGNSSLARFKQVVDSLESSSLRVHRPQMMRMIEDSYYQRMRSSMTLGNSEPMKRKRSLSS